MNPCCPIPSASTDPAFPRALDRELIARIVHRDLLEDPAMGPIELQPDYVRWKDQDGSIVGWRAFLGADRQPSYVTIRTAPIERLEDNLAKIEHHADRESDGLRSMTLDRENGLLLIAFPIDRQMPDLRRLVRASKVRSLVTKNRPDLIPESLRISKSKSRFQLVRYKPERRAVLRWDLGFKDENKKAVPGPTVWIRTLAAPLPQRDALIELARGNGIRVPEVLSAPHDCLLLESHLEGRSWQREDQDAVELVATTLARLHAVALPPQPPLHDHTAEMALVRQSAADLNRLDQQLGSRADRLADALEASAKAESAPVLLHGDFHMGQVLVSQDAGLCDFDRACAGPAAADLAAFAAHVLVADPSGGRPFADAFLTAYRATGSQLPALEVRWWTVAALVRMASTPFRRLSAEWPQQSSLLLDLAAAELARSAV
jgi:aminoglycoside phosphotransferase